MLCGVMPPTGHSGVPAGNTDSSAFSPPSAEGLEREQLQRMRSGLERGERLGRRGDAGRGEHAERHGAGNDAPGCSSAPPSAGRRRRCTASTSATLNIVPPPTSVPGRPSAPSVAMHSQRAGPVQRHFEQAKARVEQRAADVGSARRLEPAQDRDERRSESLSGPSLCSFRSPPGKPATRRVGRVRASSAVTVQPNMRADGGITLPPVPPSRSA